MDKTLFEKLRIPIIDGFEGGAVFNIYPTEQTAESFLDNNVLPSVCITIDEDYMEEFLAYFMKRHIHHTEYEDFMLSYNLAWWGEDDYSYPSMNDMLADIEEHIELLKNDFDNPCLDELKKRFWCNYFLVHELSFSVTDEEQKNWVKNNIEIAIDFYSRFIELVRKMMQECSECKYVSFVGP